jgi:2'-5' RNA ligase
MSRTIRAFIAIELPPPVIALLGKIQQDLKSLRVGARWVRPENIHLTLKFLGDINPAEVEKICTAMTAAAEGVAPLTLAVGGIGVFPDLKRPRVIWVGLAGEIQPLLAFQHNLENRLSDVGFPKEKRSFKGHLTLGRFKEPANRDTIRRAMAEYSDMENERFEAGRMVLFKSDLNPSGAVYSHVKWVELEK